MTVGLAKGDWHQDAASPGMELAKENQKNKENRKKTRNPKHQEQEEVSRAWAGALSKEQCLPGKGMRLGPPLGPSCYLGR